MQRSLRTALSKNKQIISWEKMYIKNEHANVISLLIRCGSAYIHVYIVRYLLINIHNHFITPNCLHFTSFFLHIEIKHNSIQYYCTHLTNQWVTKNLYIYLYMYVHNLTIIALYTIITFYNIECVIQQKKTHS